MGRSEHIDKLKTLKIMYTYTFGGKNGTKHTLHESTDMVAVRTRNSRDLANSVISEKGT